MSVQEEFPECRSSANQVMEHTYTDNYQREKLDLHVGLYPFMD